MFNQVVLLGNLGADPESRVTPQGTPVAHFNLAVNKSWTNNQLALVRMQNPPTLMPSSAPPSVSGWAATSIVCPCIGSPTTPRRNNSRRHRSCQAGRCPASSQHSAFSAQQSSVKVAVGLLVHEVGHFLQPLKEVNAVEAQENVPHWLANVCLDIQAESLLQSLFPTFKLPLAEVRRTVKRKQLGDYEAAIGKATTFVEAAGSLALWGRFVKPILPFYAESLPQRTPDEKTAVRFMDALDGFRSCPARRLPERLAWLIHEFPELRQATIPIFPQGMERVQGQATGSLGDALRQEASRHTAGLAGGGDNAEIQVHNAQPTPPLGEAVVLARTIRTRFLTLRGGVNVLAPGRFERRAAARGELPLRMTLPGREVPAPKLVLCLDASGSMGAPCPGSEGRSKWQVAQIAAQAVALSVQSAGGHVVGVVFGDGAWMTPAGDATPLFLPQSLNKGRVGSGTCFRFLVELWRRYPHHQVLVLTDGSGTAPDGMLPNDWQRTHAVIIPRGDAVRARAWSVRQIVLKDLRHLAAVLAILVPRAKLG